MNFEAPTTALALLLRSRKWKEERRKREAFVKRRISGFFMEVAIFYSQYTLKLKYLRPQKPCPFALECAFVKKVKIICWVFDFP